MKQPTCLSDNLLSMTEEMYQHACKGDWDKVRNIDDTRLQLIRQAMSAGTSFNSKELSDRLRDYQNSILQMAIQERDNIATEYRASKNKAANCNYYLKNNTE